MRLLSVDWDYFFPMPGDLEDKDFLYDWGHREDISFILLGIWDIRAAAFLRAEKPLPTTSTDEKDFWDQFRFSANAVLYYADSHSYIYRPEVSTGISEIWNFDAHHDSFHSLSEVIKSERVTCDNWATVLHAIHGVKIHTLLPKWAEHITLSKPKTEISIKVDPGVVLHKTFDRVFLCRSGAWTPTWVEDKFWEFLESSSLKNKVALDKMTRRTFVLQNAIDLNNQLVETTKLGNKFRERR